MGISKKEKDKRKKKKERIERERKSQRFENIRKITLVVLLMLGFFMLGMITGALVGSEEIVVGLFSHDFCGYGDDWIHIRVNEGDSFKRLVEVCNHEAGHELFCRLTDRDGGNSDCWGEVGENYAEVCESYPRLCLDHELFGSRYEYIDNVGYNLDNVRIINATWTPGGFTLSGIGPKLDDVYELGEFL